MRIYISGPISGLPFEEVQKAFNEAERVLRLNEWETINPLNNGLPKESTWNEHMRADLKLLLDCEAIYLLQGWHKSMGACMELDIARGLGMEIVFEENKAEKSTMNFTD
ncbi:uncharacterized protein DUF4406 [Dysgonomonas alginatilytica]|uniref:Uncharacterized protein DUF4406 n=1 Tax=Dysgonomonas alginatilytica TaxID=1605892 RepID=A0A2V3PLW7_9BACT|nr:DUF4406 domain-containing protein [Dysgonomonas alginatilytica]PXV61196.1 uncharacterized protein DUF4406 [Dysgonomonas alginatilytica]